MWNWSDAALLKLAGGHTAVSRVDVLHGGTPSGVTLIPTGGTVSVDATRPVRWNLGCTLVDPTGELSRGDVEDLLDPYECEIAVWRGVRLTTYQLIPTQETYRYFRFVPMAVRAGGIMQISEFAMLGASGRLTGMTVSTSGSNSSPPAELPANAADNNTSTKWLNLNGVAAALVYDFGAPVTATGYHWATANDLPDRDPVSWQVEGSDDGSAWTVLDAQTSYPTPTSRFTTLPFTFPSAGSTSTSVDELAPLGVYALTSRSVDDSPDGLVIGLTGQDRSIGYQGPMSGALTISAGTPVEDAVEALLARRNHRLTLQAMNTGFTVGPLVFQPDIDVWKEAQDLAVSVGARLFHDRTGQCVLALAGPASDRPVAVYEEGDGLLLDVSRQEDSDTIKNVVVAQNTSGSIIAVAADTDTTSPTYYKGRYGERPFTLVNQHIHSVTQATQAATTRLAYELGRSETVDFTCVVDPGRDVDEVVTIHRPRAGLDRRAVVVASLDIPLAATDSMRVGCRQSRLAPDGEVLEEI